jgi:hypothetical protein
MNEVDVPPVSAPDPGLSELAVSAPIDPGADGVEAGAVFLARNRQQRRVWAVREGRVHFFVRPPGGGAFWSPGHPAHLAPTIELFLAEVAACLAPGAQRKRPIHLPSHGPDRPIPPHKNAYR